MSTRHIGRGTAMIAATAVVVASCGGGSDPEPAGARGDVEVPDAGDFIEDPEGAAAEMVESVEQVQAAQGGGSARLVVGDREWNFSSVLCAFGEDEIGQEGAEFVLSSIEDGMQMYVSIDRFGHSVSLNDIEDFDNPSVDLGTFGDAAVELDGKRVTAAADFMDGTTDDGVAMAGKFEATCP